MTTKIARVLELLARTSTSRDVNEAKMSGLRERRMFFEVTFHTSAGDERVIVEAPTKQLALENAQRLITAQRPAVAELIAPTKSAPLVTVFSAFTPAEVPFIDTTVAGYTDEKVALFKEAKSVLAKAALRNNKSEYVVPKIAMMKPDDTTFTLVHAYDVPASVKDGYVVIGKNGARRRQGYSDTPYGH